MLYNMITQKTTKISLKQYKQTETVKVNKISMLVLPKYAKHHNKNVKNTKPK